MTDAPTVPVRTAGGGATGRRSAGSGAPTSGTTGAPHGDGPRAVPGTVTGQQVLGAGIAAYIVGLFLEQSAPFRIGAPRERQVPEGWARPAWAP